MSKMSLHLECTNRTYEIVTLTCRRGRDGAFESTTGHSHALGDARKTMRPVYPTHWLSGLEEKMKGKRGGVKERAT